MTPQQLKTLRARIKAAGKTRCRTCGQAKNDHQRRHPFISTYVAFKNEEVLELLDYINKLEKELAVDPAD